MTPGLCVCVCARACKADDGTWPASARVRAPLQRADQREQRPVDAKAGLRYGELSGGGGSTHFTCFTGTRVQILTWFLQVSWVLRGVPHEVAFANDVASFEKARAQLLAGQVHSGYLLYWY